MTIDVAADTAGLLKVLGEPLRWEIVRRLAAEDLCTCHLVAELDAAQPLVSHHLRVLREAGMVHPEPAGQFTYYVLDRAGLDTLADLLGGLAIDPPQGHRRRPCG